MRTRLTLIAAACLALVAAPHAYAACQDNYAGATQPHFARTLAVSVRELCFADFAVGHSATTHTALWSAEHLTASEIEAARSLPRRDMFHAERRLPAGERAELADYVRSGFDRGHLTPSGDMPTPQAQSESFTLANVVPQNSTLNRGLWENIEVAVRDLRLPEQIRINEPFDVRASVFSTRSSHVHLALMQGESINGLDGERVVTLEPGENELRFRSVVRVPGDVTYSLTVEPQPGADRFRENNRFVTTASVPGPPSVLYVEGDTTHAQYFRAALSGGDFEVETRGAREFPSTLRELERFDFVVLSDVGAESVSQGAQVALALALQSGCSKSGTTSPGASSSPGAAIDPAARAEAKEIFGSRCTVCHGPQGEGNGPASAGLTPRPRNLTDKAWQGSVTDEHIEKIIQYGGAAVGKSAAMPPNPDLASKAATVAALREHVRSLAK